MKSAFANVTGMSCQVCDSLSLLDLAIGMEASADVLGIMQEWGACREFVQHQGQSVPLPIT